MIVFYTRAVEVRTAKKLFSGKHMSYVFYEKEQTDVLASIKEHLERKFALEDTIVFFDGHPGEISESEFHAMESEIAKRFLTISFCRLCRLTVRKKTFGGKEERSATVTGTAREY